MKNLNTRLIISLRAFAFVSLLLFTLAHSVKAQDEFADEVGKLSDGELIAVLSHQLPDKFNKETRNNLRFKIKAAAEEIFKRGEKMIPYLKKYQGNSNYYRSSPLGRSPTFIPSDNMRHPADNDGTYYTIEIAALYLISAIYYDRLEFAGDMYLDDGSCVNWMDYNKPEKVARAWQATNEWIEKLNKLDMKKLREKKISPLKDSKMNWTGDGGKFTGSFIPCDSK